MGQPLPGIEVQDRRARRDDGRGRGDRARPQRHGRLLGGRRGHRARRSATAGSTPATSGASTTRATCTSSGRSKDVIVDANGKNVYPDEIEELYRELPVHQGAVGRRRLPDGIGEQVACAVVAEPRARPGAVARPRSTRAGRGALPQGVGRPAVLEARARRCTSGRATCPRPPSARSSAARWRPRSRACAARTRRPRARWRRAGRGRAGRLAAGHGRDGVAAGRRADVQLGSRFGELGFDSLMYAELSSALENAGVALPESVDVTTLGTVAELQELLARGPAAAARERAAKRGAGRRRRRRSASREPCRARGQARAWPGRSALFYQRVLRHAGDGGQPHPPAHAASSSPPTTASHLDMGAIKVALGDAGTRSDVAGGGRLLLPQPLPARLLQALHQPGADGALGLDPQVDGHRRAACCGAGAAWSCSPRGRAR